MVSVLMHPNWHNVQTLQDNPSSSCDESSVLVSKIVESIGGLKLRQRHGRVGVPPTWSTCLGMVKVNLSESCSQLDTGVSNCPKGQEVWIDVSYNLQQPKDPGDFRTNCRVQNKVRQTNNMNDSKKVDLKLGFSR